ncbi:hypothetical protein NO1_1730 [Candidatus Termititenax aidoneus]|uniref:Uncharacterized protein n=1 Tax=Termititenax aidoneus TaxID=2218524 RepID=A0A388TDP2_TERA1|nr:hypothetical protein NO1_1730 [Candidatus Termititenax aidoneus]
MPQPTPEENHLIDLIRRPNFKPIRRCYIKRRLTNGIYEPEWVLISQISGVNTVSKWGSYSIKTEETETGDIGEFSISQLTMEFKNDDGKFNWENDNRSLWYGYLNRKFTKIRIETAYFDFDLGAEVGNTVIFEGLVDKVTGGDNQKASVVCIGYQDVLHKIDIRSAWPGVVPLTIMASELVALMLGNARVMEFFEVGSINLGVDYKIKVREGNTFLLTLTFWHNLKMICKKSSSIPLIIGNKLYVQDSNAGSELPFIFNGVGSGQNIDIYKIDQDQEGADKVRVWWKVKDTSIEAKSTDPILLLKYLDSPEEVDLSEVDTTTEPYKQSIVQRLLTKWQYPIPTVTLEVRYMNGIVWPLHKARINNAGLFTETEDGFFWNGWIWDDGSKWNGLSGAVSIFPDQLWLVDKVTYDVDKWKTSLTLSKYTLTPL